DSDIEVLEKDSEKITQIVCSGLRSGDIALRIKYAGYPTDRLIIESSLKEGIKYITNLKSETTYVLSTYTALFECRKILLDLQKQSQTTTAGRVSVRG
ncbi:MAG: MurT ligase domain-containing protein, partial [Syntrophomonadaceae bacterium]